MHRFRRIPSRLVGVVGGCGQRLHYVRTGYPGVLDPCKGFGVDAAAGLTAQQRADLTLSAQVSDYGMLCISKSISTLIMSGGHLGLFC